MILLLNEYVVPHGAWLAEPKSCMQLCRYAMRAVEQLNVYLCCASADLRVDSCRAPLAQLGHSPGFITWQLDAAEEGNKFVEESDGRFWEVVWAWESLPTLHVCCVGSNPPIITGHRACMALLVCLFVK